MTEPAVMVAVPDAAAGVLEVVCLALAEAGYRPLGLPLPCAALGRLRAGVATRDVPVVAMSVDAHRSVSRARFLAAGCAAVIGKPVALEELWSAVAAMQPVGQARGRGEPPGGPSPAATAPTTSRSTTEKGCFMFHVTERAAEKLADLRAEVDLDPEVTLALVPNGEGLELSVARPAPEDRVIEREGDPILVVSPQVADRLEGWMLDVRAADGEERFALLPEGSPADGHVTG